MYQVVHPGQGTTKASLLIYNEGSIFVDSTTVGTANTETREKNSDGTKVVIRKSTQTKMGRWLRSSSSTQVVLSHEMIGREIYAVTDQSNISWTLLDDIITVGTLKCKTATARFRGRLWRVAYAPDIPVKYGPWKLQGLPGLIVQAEDSTGQHKYRLLKLTSKVIDAPAFEHYKVEYPTISLREYLNRIEQEHKKLILSLEAKFNEIKQPGETFTVSKGESNMLELSEN
jgi:GLPGLI family protein